MSYVNHSYRLPNKKKYMRRRLYCTRLRPGEFQDPPPPSFIRKLNFYACMTANATVCQRIPLCWQWRQLSKIIQSKEKAKLPIVKFTIYDWIINHKSFVKRVKLHLCCQNSYPYSLYTCSSTSIYVTYLYTALIHMQAANIYLLRVPY